jgi:hypothetical protein
MFPSCLQAACNDEDGLQHLRNNVKVLQRLCHNVPKITDVSEFQEWPVQQVQDTVLLLIILEKITNGYKFGMFDISLLQVSLTSYTLHLCYTELLVSFSIKL